MLTPKQKQRILTATGWTVEVRPGFGYLLIDKDDDNVSGYQETELAAWDSWEPDANWCETELKPLLRGLSAEEQRRFDMHLRWAGYNFYYDTNQYLAFTPELLCTAFDTYLLERDGNK